MPYTDRYLVAQPSIEVSGRAIKRYHISAAPGEIEAGVCEAAYAKLPDLLPTPLPDETTPPASFVILHRGAATGAYLLAYSWVWDNVIECRTAAAGIPDLGCEDTNPEHFIDFVRPWIGCVWELAPLGHERAAWIRHVLAPEHPDLDGYLADLLPDGTTEVVPAWMAGAAP